MVRINIIEPWKLSDQHLIAEYLEILMLLGHVRVHGVKSEIPSEYKLGTGHITFFKNKLKYLKERHEEIKKEMRKRGFATKVNISLDEFDKKYHNHWKPGKRDFEIIKKRLIWKIGKKPNYYRYYGEKKGKKFFLELMNSK